MHVSQINLGANLDAGRGGQAEGCNRGRPICMVISTGRSRRSNSSLSRAYYAVAPKKKEKGKGKEKRKEKREERKRRKKKGGSGYLADAWNWKDTGRKEDEEDDDEEKRRRKKKETMDGECTGCRKGGVRQRVA